MSGHEFEAISQFTPTVFSMDSHKQSVSSEEADGGGGKCSRRRKNNKNNRTKKKRVLKMMDAAKQSFAKRIRWQFYSNWMVI